MFGSTDISLDKNLSAQEWVVSCKLDDLEELEASTDNVKRLYFIRHGQSVLNLPNEEGVFVTQGRSNEVPLTEKGIEQARILKSKLHRKIDISRVEIVASLARRAQQTASAFLKSGAMRNLEGLCELSAGVWEGKLKDAAYHRELSKWQALSAKEKWTVPKVSTGESYSQVADRAMADLAKLVADPSLKGKTIFVFTHNMTMNSLAIRWSNEPLPEEAGTNLPYFHFDNCDIMMVELQSEESIEHARVKRIIHSTASNA